MTKFAPLMIAGLLVLAAVGGAVYALSVTAPSREADARAPGWSTSHVEPRGAEPRVASAPPAAAPKAPRTGRVLDLDAAIRELDLIRPARQKVAEDFSLRTPDGGTFRLSDHRGKVVLVNFWATWCPPCREEIPALVRLHAAYHARGVNVVGVAVESGSRHAVSQFAQGFGMTYPIVLGDIATAQRYRVMGVPVSFLVDAEGRVVHRWTGPYSEETFATAINTLLAETEATP